jgi:NB-ARC domain
VRTGSPWRELNPAEQALLVLASAARIRGILRELAAAGLIVPADKGQSRRRPATGSSPPRAAGSRNHRRTPARAHPPQAVYQAYREQSDIFIGIYWQRYGWVGPGMTVSGLADELQLAAEMPRPLYVKVPAPGMEPGLKRMLEGVRSEGALAYKKFTNAGELRDLVAGDLAARLAEGFAAPERARRWAVLPSPWTALVGRDADVKEVARMLTAPGRRLVVLTGAGGTGKRRLALAVAERTSAQWPDGAAFVDLSQVSDPGLVPDAIASALGLVGQGRERPLDTVARGLAGRDVLLVLDNFEQVLNAAPVVAELLPRAPGLHALVTSRVVLRLRGEQEWQVEPLKVSRPGTTLEAVAENPAVRLFVDRARDVQPGFGLTSENAETVAELCRRLDGLPLALELAAASMRTLTPEAVLARLPQQLERPGALADLPGRQQTLAATIQWSYDLLPAPAQRLLAQLSVLAGPVHLWRRSGGGRRYRSPANSGELTVHEQEGRDRR